MKNTIILSITLLVIISFSCTGQIKRKISSNVIKPDSITLNLYNDTINNIIFSPKKVICYTLNPMADSNKDNDTIGIFVIKDKVGKLHKSYYSILQFLMHSKSNYDLESPFIFKCPFAPYVAFEFIKGREKAIVYIAFNCKEWGIYHNNKLVKYKYDCYELLIDYLVPLLPEDKYIQTLQKDL